MANIANLLTENMAIWTAADTEKKSGRGRASGNAVSVYGVKKLRELILELAVRGKLVPQDHNDEPASELIKRIQAEKAKLIAEGKLKKEKSLAPLAVEEKPFELPDQWGYEKLCNLSYFITKGTTPTTLGFSYQSEGVKFVKVENINSGRVNLESIDQFISDEANEVLSRSKLIEGDVLFSIAGTIGKTCIVHAEDLPANTNQALAIIRGSKLVFEQKFLLNQLDSFVSNKTKDKARGGAMNNVSLTDLSELVVIVPPLAEQHRIVAKVDELMALCDQLEQQHSNAQEAHEILVSQLLATLTQSQNATEFNANWQRIYAYFDVLFTTEASIDSLKQTLLQLAIMGKLVPQDASDEPASELLKRIQAEKAKLIAEGKLKKEKPLAPISENEKPFDLPKGWQFARLREIATHIGDGLHGTPVYTTTGKYYFVNGNNLKDGKIVIKHETKTVDVNEYEKYKKPLSSASILVSINGTLGTVGFYNGEPIILGKSACYINLVKEKVSKYFIRILIDAPSFMEYAFKNAAGTTIKNLGLKAINDMPVALPPLSEQHRIVARVGIFMELCDQLKTRIQQTKQQQQAIADALVAKAVN